MSEENAKKDDVLEFLKGYVDVLRSDFPWKSIAPCNPRAEMAGGVAKVEISHTGETIAYFHTKWPEGTYNPSMPVSPRDFACAKLLADTINLLAEKREIEMADLLGWLGCLCFSLCAISQAWKTYCDGYSHGLTWLFITMWFSGEVFYIGGTLLKFGWVHWIMWNCIISTVAILVIMYYMARPRPHTRVRVRDAGTGKRSVKLKASKLALVWDELKKLSREDDLDLGGLCWCDLLFAFSMHIDVEEDVFVNCQDGCDRFSTDNCFLV